MSNDIRFILIGTGGLFTYQVSKRLLELDYQPLAYVQYGIAAKKTATHFADIEIESRTVDNPLTVLLHSSAIPTHYYATLDLAGFIKGLNVDYLLLACWPTLIPQTVIASVNIAALNLHPSLLPRFRGIDPISAQLNSNDPAFGVSLHLLNDQYDCGDIVLQQVLTDPPMTKPAIETACAIMGAELFIQASKTQNKPGWKLIKQVN